MNLYYDREFTLTGAAQVLKYTATNAIKAGIKLRAFLCNITMRRHLPYQCKQT